MSRYNVVVASMDELVKVDVRCASGLLTQIAKTKAIGERLRENGPTSWTTRHKETSWFKGMPSGIQKPIREDFLASLNKDIVYELSEMLAYISY